MQQKVLTDTNKSVGTEHRPCTHPLRKLLSCNLKLRPKSRVLLVKETHTTLKTLTVL